MKIMPIYAKQQPMASNNSFCQRNLINNDYHSNALLERQNNTNEMGSFSYKPFFAVNKKINLSSGSFALNFKGVKSLDPAYEKTIMDIIGLTTWGNLGLKSSQKLKCTNYNNGVVTLENWHQPLGDLTAALEAGKPISETCKGLVLAWGDYLSRFIPKDFGALIKRNPDKSVSFHLLMRDKSKNVLSANTPEDIAEILKEYNGFIIRPLDKSIISAEDASTYNHLLSLEDLESLYSTTLNLRIFDSSQRVFLDVDRETLGYMKDFVPEKFLVSNPEYKPKDKLLLTLNNQGQIIPKTEIGLKELNTGILEGNAPLKTLIENLNGQINIFKLSA